MENFKQAVLIDNDALVKLSQVNGILDLMRNLYHRIEVPTKIKEEFEMDAAQFNPERIPILNQLRPNTGFWSLCTHLDVFSQALLFNYKGIDEGEAELISQGEKKGIRVIISDDGAFKKTADSLFKNFLIVNPLFVFASLDINSFLPNREMMIRTYHSIRPFKSREFRNAYEIALREYRIKWTKKKISEKTSLKRLGINT